MGVSKVFEINLVAVKNKNNPEAQESKVNKEDLPKIIEKPYSRIETINATRMLTHR